MNNGSSTARSLAFLAAAIGMWATSAAQTATDACSYDAGNEYTVGTSCTFSAFNKPTAFVANLNPGGCNSGNYDDAFGWFTATSTTTILTYDPNDSHRPVMHVFTGACGSLTQVGCVDAGANDSNAELMLQTTVGTNYMIRIQRYNTSGAMNGRLCVWSPYSTNLCGFPDISQIPVGGTCDPRPFLKPTAYTAAMNPGGCNSGNYDDAFGWFTATGTHTVITYDPDASHRPIMHVFTGTCGSLTQVACVDAGANGSNAELVLPTVVGTSYLIRIQRYNTSDEMNGTICVWTPNTTDVCDFPAFSRIPVDFPCTPRPFENPAAYVPNYNPGGCNAGNYDDAYGWFTATSTTTIITYDPDGSQRP
ncbi:MAG: hypothetical protein KF797_13910, partial [Flavobacteriales bacterium]|nr:hypothetical protein [Flavobacteriales bacterium]